ELGLAHLAVGQFGEALELFRIVAQVTPDYQDAQKRIEVLLAWKEALMPNAQVRFPDAVFGLRVVLGVPVEGGPPAKLKSATVASIPASGLTSWSAPARQSQPPPAPAAAATNAEAPNQATAANPGGPSDAGGTSSQTPASRYEIAGELGRGGMAVVY